MSGTQLEMAQRLILAGCHYGMAQSLGEVFDILDPLVRLKAGTWSRCSEAVEDGRRRNRASVRGRLRHLSDR